MNRTPNLAAAVAAPISSLFHLPHELRRGTRPRCWAEKSIPFTEETLP
jgi:hypothetical protein